METRRNKRALYVLGLIVSLFVWRAGIAIAQQSLVVPPPLPQATPSVRYHPKATPHPTPPSSAVETIPVARQPAEPAPEPTPPAAAQQSEPALPAIFRGCWEGVVSRLDSIERVPGGAQVGPWTPKTYRLCYERTGNAPFEMTFTEAGVTRSRRITNANGQIQVLSTDGRTYATMRAFLHFDEYRIGTSYFGGNTFPVDEVTQLQANILPDGMHVLGQVTGNRNGSPWFRATWNAVFVHVSEPPIPAASGNGLPE